MVLFFLRRRLPIVAAVVVMMLIYSHYHGIESRRAASQDAPSSADHDAPPEAQQLNLLTGDVSPDTNWAKIPQKHPVKTFITLPVLPPKDMVPRIQASSFKSKNSTEAQVQQDRLAAVLGNFTHAWRGYRERAWLQDEVAPISGGANNPFAGWGATLVDALGTLWIMGLKQDFEDAVKAVEMINFSNTHVFEINVFETTIRYLGGLLSAYDMSDGKYPSLLQKATELGEMLYHAFDTPNRMPVARWNFRIPFSAVDQVASSFACVAELGSLSLEFTRLTQLTKDPKYFDAIQRIADVFEQQQDATQLPGMWPVSVNAKDIDFSFDSTFTLGGMADSMYEYLPKQHLMMNGATKQFHEMYEKAMEPIKSHIFHRPMTPDQRDILLAGQAYVSMDSVTTETEGQHLACFVGGMVGLAARIFGNDEDMDFAKRLVEGCLWAYESMPLGIMPERFYVVSCPDLSPCRWNEARWHAELMANHPEYANVNDILAERHLPQGMTRVNDTRYLLRPEAIESVFYLYRLTGDTTLQDRAWTMFENIVKHTTTEIAHAALADCTANPPPKEDSMESFWLAETLRYFYLIFADESLISLDDYVLNTEAHPLRRTG